MKSIDREASHSIRADPQYAEETSTPTGTVVTGSVRNHGKLRR